MEPILTKTPKRVKVEITPSLITDILRDRLHCKLSIAEIKTKYNIGNEKLKTILKAYSEEFIKKFPPPENKAPIALDEMVKHWG